MVSRGYKFRLHDALKAAEEEEDLTAEFTNYKDAFRAAPGFSQVCFKGLRKP